MGTKSKLLLLVAVLWFFVGSGVGSNLCLAGESEDFFNDGDGAFNNGEYEQAKILYIRAIQLDPSNVQVYLHLAHTYHILEDFEMAVIMYDNFLSLSKDGLSLEKERAQRDGANDMRADPGSPPQLLSYQTEPLQALQTKLKEGPFLTEGNGGAWALFTALLRSGYASPELVGFQKTLVEGLLSESDTLWVLNRGPLPNMDISGWELLLNHYLYAERLGFPLTEVSRTLAKKLTCEGFLAYYDLNFDRALILFKQALESDPEFIQARWGEIIAYHSGGQMDDAYNRARELEESLRSKGETNPWMPLLVGVILKNKGDTDSAAAYFHRLLYPE